jgi:hypothetical protein
MGATDATLDSRDGAYSKGILHLSHSPQPIEASVVGSHVKSTPELIHCFGMVALKKQNGGSHSPEQWLKLLRIILTDFIGSAVGIDISKNFMRLKILEIF